MKIAHINIQGLGKKVVTLQHLLQSFDIDILCISEVSTKQNVNILGYKFFRNDRCLDKHGGGVGIFTKSHLDVVNFGKNNEDNIETIWVDIKYRNTFVRIACCYCPPSIPLTKKAFDSLYIKNKLILCGDFNAKHIALGNSISRVNTNPSARKNGEALVDIIDSSDLYVLSKGEATHTATNGTSDQLDLFFCSGKLAQKTTEVEVLPDLTGSDHLPILINLDIHLSQPIYPALRLNLKKANWAKFYRLVDGKVNFLEKFVSENVLDIFDEIDTLASGLTDAIVHGKCGSIPTCQAHEVRCTPVTPELLDAIHKRRDLRRTYMLTGNRIDKTNYNRATKLVRTLSQKSRVDKLKKECSNMNNHCFQNSKIFWKKVHCVLSNCSASSAIANFPLKDSSGNPILDNKIKANIFASHLEKVFTVAEGPEFNDKFKWHIERILKNFTNILTPTRDTNRTVDPMCILSFDDVNNCIRNLFNKAPGHDNITNALLRHCPPSYVTCLTRLFNLILKHGYIPKLWKFAHVVMIPKEGKDLSLPSSYRPISLLPSQPKVLERIMAMRLLLKMEQLNILPDFQSAFQNKKCTNDHLFRLSQDVSVAKNKNEETVICCLDNQGAFDCAWPDGILFRMIETRIPDDFIRYSSNFLTGRTFLVRIGSSFSSIKNAQAGVPQGSSLSPHFYNLLVSNIFSKSRILIRVRIGHFADDIAAWASDIIRKNAVDRIQKTLDDVSDWMSLWRQRLNSTKSQGMIFTNKGHPDSKTICLKIRGVSLEWRDSVVYLGVQFDRLLNWKIQFNYMSKRFSDRLKILIKLCHRDFGISSKVAIIIYKAFIRPVIEYGCPAFLQLQNNHISKIQIMQNKALRLALRAPYDTPLVELHKKAKIPFIESFLKMRAAKFISSAIENNVLSGREALYYLNSLSDEELERTPLGAIKDLIIYNNANS